MNCDELVSFRLNSARGIIANENTLKTIQSDTIELKAYLIYDMISKKLLITGEILDVPISLGRDGFSKLWENVPKFTFSEGIL